MLLTSVVLAAAIAPAAQSPATPPQTGAAPTSAAPTSPATSTDSTPEPGSPTATQTRSGSAGPEQAQDHVLPVHPATEDPVERALLPVSGGLTAEQVAATAVAESTTIAERRAALDIAAAKVDQTMYGFFPQLKLDFTYTRLSDIDLQFGSASLVGAMNPGGLTVGPCPQGTGQCVLDSAGVPVGAAPFSIPVILDNWSAKATLSVPLSDYVFRLATGLTAARKAKEAAELMADAERLKVETDSRLAYYDWLRALAQVAVAEDSLMRAQARYREAEVAFDAGVLAQADLLSIESFVATVEQGLIGARAMEYVARVGLATIMDQPITNYAVGEDVLRPVTDAGETGKLDDLMAEATKQRLEARAVQLNREALQQAVRAERVNYYPRLDAFGEFNYANPNQRYFPLTKEWNHTWAAGAGITWFATRALATRANVQELKAQGRQLEAQLEGLRRGLKMEVAGAWVERENARAALAPAAKAKVAAKAASTAMGLRFQVGDATAVQVLEAESALINAYLRDVNARINLKVGEIKLEYATGRLQIGRGPSQSGATKTAAQAG